MIAQNWNKAQQYTNELKTDETYDLEIREALQSECVDCTQEGNFSICILFANITKGQKKHKQWDGL